MGPAPDQRECGLPGRGRDADADGGRGMDHVAPRRRSEGAGPADDPRPARPPHSAHRGRARGRLPPFRRRRHHPRTVDQRGRRRHAVLSARTRPRAVLLPRLRVLRGAEVALGKLERDYQTKKSAYDQLLGQQSKITLGADAASQQQGEGIEVVDPANLPSKPVAPKRFLLSAIGLAFGLGVGLILTGIFEIPRLLTIQSSEDARHYTGLPVLISVPELLTPQEAKSIPRRRRLLLAAGFAVTIVSIPLLALALRATHVFEFLMSSSGRTS